MSKKSKETNGVIIEFELPAKVVAYLDEMVEIGLWGDTREEVCLTLIREGIREHWDIIKGVRAQDPAS